MECYLKTGKFQTVGGKEFGRDEDISMCGRCFYPVNPLDGLSGGRCLANIKPCKKGDYVVTPYGMRRVLKDNFNGKYLHIDRLSNNCALNEGGTYFHVYKATWWQVFKFKWFGIDTKSNCKMSARFF